MGMCGCGCGCVSVWVALCCCRSCQDGAYRGKKEADCQMWVGPDCAPAVVEHFFCERPSPAGATAGAGVVDDAPPRFRQLSAKVSAPGALSSVSAAAAAGGGGGGGGSGVGGLHSPVLSGGVDAGRRRVTGNVRVRRPCRQGEVFWLRSR